MTARLLSGEVDRAEIAARDAHARARGVSGVPTFIVANQYVLQGAQPPHVWTGLIDELAARRESAAL
jgi:predicted DsbA family dithiol-disulfide isomerase